MKVSHTHTQYTRTYESQGQVPQVWGNACMYATQTTHACMPHKRRFPIHIWVQICMSEYTLKSKIQLRFFTGTILFCIPHQQLLGCEVSTLVPFFCLNCTTDSELKFIFDLYHQRVSRGRHLLVSSGRIWHPMHSKKFFVLFVYAT